MTDWTTQGVAFQVGDGASPEVFTPIANITNTGDLSIVRSKLDNTKLNSNNKTSIPGLQEFVDLNIEGTYDPNDPQTALLLTRVRTEDQTVENYKLDLDTSPNEVWTMGSYIGNFTYKGVAPDGLQMFSATLFINSLDIGAT